MNQTIIDLGNVENTCFVVMPFSSLFQVEYEKIISPALKELNITPVRGDEIYSKQRIVDDIWNSIKSCRFVLAELTGKNPNVLYEIGLAHAIGKPVIIITRNGDDVPFDLKALRYLFYDVNDPHWGENLKIGIQNLSKKVIENPTIEKYLDGISTPSFTFPELQKEQPIKKEKLEKLNISGTWQGEFLDYENIAHKVNLHFSPEHDFFSGAAVISFTSNEQLTVVQQIMDVNINKNQIKMHGVNYTYIEQGSSEGYALDNFTLEYRSENDTLTGFVISELKDKRVINTNITFNRI